MADYKELLYKAIGALPEENGASRRQVYERARNALAKQLDAIQPALQAREKTQLRLQLEDCIREVEHEATDALLSGLTRHRDSAAPEAGDTAAPAQDGAGTKTEPEPESEQEPEPESILQREPEPEPEPEPKARLDTKSESKGAPKSKRETEAEPAAKAVKDDLSEAATDSIEDVIAEAEKASAELKDAPAAEKVSKTPSEQMAEAMSKAKDAGADMGGRSAVETATQLLQGNGAATPESGRAAPAGNDGDVAVAMSAVREVEVDPVSAPESDADSQATIDHAIAVLDREARGESDGGTGDFEVHGDAPGGGAEAGRGAGGLTIFLIVFAFLLAGAGGAGYWAWQEGYLNLDALFAQTTPAGDAGEAVDDGGNEPPPQTGNTTVTPDTSGTPADELAKSEDRLPGDSGTEPATPDSAPGDSAATSPAIPDAAPGADTDPVKSEDRLPTDGGEVTDEPGNGAPAASETISGSQSLLLEASSAGTTGAVPFSGTVEWSRGVDELGQPTLIATANIPARNLGAEILLRKNSDQTLPASHLMEITFNVPDSFLGGAVAGLPGVLMKSEELVQGTPLVGASARIVSNSFLFALSASEEDRAGNLDLLGTRKWMDLALIYATGKRAIITLEKDEDAQKLFDEVLVAWAEPAQN